MDDDETVSQRRRGLWVRLGRMRAVNGGGDFDGWRYLWDVTVLSSFSSDYQDQRIFCSVRLSSSISGYDKRVTFLGGLIFSDVLMVVFWVLNSHGFAGF